MIDLHTHSYFSDGSESPATVAQLASELGLTAIALTDHDTTASHDEMAAACAQRGIELIPGVEVSVRDHEFRSRSTGEKSPTNVHLLAYFVPLDPASQLQTALSSLRDDRRHRNVELIALLHSLGFTRVTYDVVVALARGEASVGRPHFARAMTQLHPEIVGEASDDTTSRIFAEWLGQGGRAYLPKTNYSIEQYVAAGADEGVVFSIAHPLVNYAPGANLDEIARFLPPVLSSLRDRGVHGVEAYYGDLRVPDEVLRELKDARGTSRLLGGAQ